MILGGEVSPAAEPAPAMRPVFKVLLWVIFALALMAGAWQAVLAIAIMFGAVLLRSTEGAS